MEDTGCKPLAFTHMFYLCTHTHTYILYTYKHIHTAPQTNKNKIKIGQLKTLLMSWSVPEGLLQVRSSVGPIYLRPISHPVLCAAQLEGRDLCFSPIFPFLYHRSLICYESIKVLLSAKVTPEDSVEGDCLLFCLSSRFPGKAWV